MSVVKYGGNRIIPAPLISIQKVYNRLPNGSVVGKTYNLTLNGTLVAYMGSPSSSGSFHTVAGFPPDENISTDARLGAILRKQEALRDLFSHQGSSLFIQSLDGSQAMTCNPRVVDVNFPEGGWHTQCPYTITLETDELYPKQEDAFSEYISDAQESWNLDSEDTPEGLLLPRSYRVTHTVSAVGKTFYSTSGTIDTPAWQQARSYVLSRLEFDTTIALSSGVNNLPTSYNAYNHVRSTIRDENGGSFSVVESWILTSGTYKEDFTVSTTESLSEAFTSVSVAGNIEGFDIGDSGLVSTHKYTNALSRFNAVSGLALTRAQNYSGKTLNITPISTTIGKNPVAGTVSYTFDYNTRPSNLFSSAKSEIVSINNSFGVDGFAAVPVLGRAAGDLLQPLGTRRACETTLNMELIMHENYMPTGINAQLRFRDYNPRVHAPESGVMQAIVQAADPVGRAWNNLGAIATTGYISNQTETWNPSNFSYSRQISWTYE